MIPKEIMKKINLATIIMLFIGFAANFYLSLWLVRREGSEGQSLLTRFGSGFWNTIRSLYYFFGGLIIYAISLIVITWYFLGGKSIEIFLFSGVLYILLFLYFAFSIDVYNRMTSEFSKFMQCDYPGRMARKETILFKGSRSGCHLDNIKS